MSVGKNMGVIRELVVSDETGGRVSSETVRRRVIGKMNSREPLMLTLIDPVQQVPPSRLFMVEFPVITFNRDPQGEAEQFSGPVGAGGSIVVTIPGDTREPATASLVQDGPDDYELSQTA